VGEEFDFSAAGSKKLKNWLTASGVKPVAHA
jgi:hypothetical protein